MFWSYVFVGLMAIFIYRFGLQIRKDYMLRKGWSFFTIEYPPKTDKAQRLVLLKTIEEMLEDEKEEGDGEHKI